MKLCQTCNSTAADETSYCPHDGEPLVPDPLATALQISLGTKYTLTKLIGSGSMGAVYRAQHQSLDEVAIKVMLGPPSNQKLSERFLREARALRKLRHQHSVLVYDLERSPTGLTYMVMEMVEGRSLRDELKARGRLPLNETMEIVEAVCGALQAAHERGIIHRDLKPDNVLLAEEKTNDGEVSQLIKIADFGIVKLRGTQQGGEEASMQLTNHGMPIGTPLYMSPEQWFGDGPGFTGLDGRTDIYALGCTIYEMLSGRPPFLGHTTEELRRRHLDDAPRPLNEIVPQISEAVSRAVLRSLEKDRDLRPSSPEEFANELLAACGGNAKGSLREARSSAGSNNDSSGNPEDSISADKLKEFQRTEESVPFLRGWANEEAREAIEHVRDLHVQAPRQTATNRPSEERAEARPRPRPPEITKESKIRPRSAPAAEKPSARKKAITPVVEPEFQAALLLEKKPQRPAASEPAAEANGEMRELLLAYVDERCIGLFLDETDGVTEWRAPVPIPFAPAAVLGVVSVHGRMLTVLDPLATLGEGPASASPAFIIALRSDEQLALAVSRVDSPIKIQREDITPLAGDSEGGSVRGVIARSEGTITVLDTRELFAAAAHVSERRRQRT
ncbi:MAG: eukaryotic-like serine/threonine-protein kinase [Acidobacteriota bacterium]|jgi:serine/threonine protein kinase/chemotaxis signal transduction protein|nr:eukaryotic-like serine/threonine-protein kinase [Acidobacteriota bacterium]